MWKHHSVATQSIKRFYIFLVDRYLNMRDIVQELSKYKTGDPSTYNTNSQRSLVFPQFWLKGPTRWRSWRGSRWWGLHDRLCFSRLNFSEALFIHHENLHTEVVYINLPSGYKRDSNQKPLDTLRPNIVIATEIKLPTWLPEVSTRVYGMLMTYDMLLQSCRSSNAGRLKPTWRARIPRGRMGLAWEVTALAN